MCHSWDHHVSLSISREASILFYPFPPSSPPLTAPTLVAFLLPHLTICLSFYHFSITHQLRTNLKKKKRIDMQKRKKKSLLLQVMCSNKEEEICFFMEEEERCCLFMGNWRRKHGYIGNYTCHWKVKTVNHFSLPLKLWIPSLAEPAFWI